MPTVHKNRLRFNITNTPGLNGNLTVGTALPSYSTLGSGDNTKEFDILIQQGQDWEIRTGCVYTHSTTTLARGTLEESSTGSSISLTSAAIVTGIMTASWGNAVITTTSQNTLSNKTFVNVAFTGSYTEQIYDIVTGTSPVIDPANGTIQTWTLTANSSPTENLSNGQSVTLMIDDGSGFSITWPTIQWKTSSGLAPSLNTTQRTAIQLWKVGGVLYGARIGNA